MDERYKLSKEESEWMVRKQELNNRLRELEGKGANVSYGEKIEVVSISEERLAEIESVRREIDEAEAKLREIREKLKKLRN